MITIVQNLVTDDRFSVDVDGAPAFCMEAEQWKKNPRTGKEIQKNNHAMSAWRYGISNAEIIEGRKRGPDELRQAHQADPTPVDDNKPKKRYHRYAKARHRYGDVAAASGGTSVPMSEQFRLNSR